MWCVCDVCVMCVWCVCDVCVIESVSMWHCPPLSKDECVRMNEEGHMMWCGWGRSSWHMTEFVTHGVLPQWMRKDTWCHVCVAKDECHTHMMWMRKSCTHDIICPSSLTWQSSWHMMTEFVTHDHAHMTLWVLPHWQHVSFLIHWGKKAFSPHSHGVLPQWMRK